MPLPDLRFVALLLAGMLCSSAAWADGCPAGTVQIGERQEETDTEIIVHPICQRVEPAADPAKDFCSFKARIALDQEAIRGLGFGTDAQRFSEWEAEAGNLRNTFVLQAVDALFDALMVDPAIEYAKSLNPWVVNTRIKALREALGKVGISPGAVETAMRALAKVRGKPALSPYAKAAVSEASMALFEKIKKAKFDAETKREDYQAEVPAAVGALVIAGKIAVKNPWLGLAITGGEMAKTAAMAYALNSNVDRLNALTDAQMSQFMIYRSRLDADVSGLAKARSAVEAAGADTDPNCSP